MPSFLSRIRARGGLTVPVLTSDATPAANELALFAKSDGNLYKKTSGGIESLIGTGNGPPSFSSQIDLSGLGTFSVASTTAGNVGNTITVNSQGPDDVFIASYTIIGQVVTAGIVNFQNFSVDGGAWLSDGSPTYSPAGSQYFTSSRSVRISGLAAGNHTIGVRSWNNAAGTTTFFGQISKIVVFRLDSKGIQGTRWGTTSIAVFGTANNCSVSFPDGGPPRIGDWVVSTNGLAPGAAYKITAVVDSTHADLDSNDGVDLRGPAGANATALNAYPVGAIYMSVVNTSPATLFGGTWAVWGTGRVPVAIDTSQTEFNTVEKTGGAKTHTLSITEMPSHTHSEEGAANVSGLLSAAGSAYGVAQPTGRTTGAAGGGGAHNNLQPYITCYMWKRTA